MEDGPAPASPGRARMTESEPPIVLSRWRILTMPSPWRAPADWGSKPTPASEMVRVRELRRPECHRDGIGPAVLGRVMQGLLRHAVERERDGARKRAGPFRLGYVDADPWCSMS